MNFPMRKLLLSVTLGLFLSSAAQALPQVRIIATGGTIAGVGQSATESNYQAGEVGISSLIAAVPEMKQLADIQGEQLVKIGSQDMNDKVWLALAKRINLLLADKDVDGIVITHGTDTLEETAYFLNLTIKSDKPVVLVGAMRPSTAMNADGPMNLYNAVATAANLESKGRGVLVVMNDTVLNARDVTKTNTTGVHTFAAPNFGPLGVIHNSKIEYMGKTERQHTRQTPFDVSKLDKLPQVGIVYNYANASDLPVKAMVEAGFDGIVSAGVGNGNIYHSIFDTLAKASQKGTLVVRSSRVPTGATTLDSEIDDAKYGFIAAGNLNPQKARILLMLSLTQSKDPQQIQRWFQQF
ncbi:L-asparaginase 2 [Shewanella sp. SM87]|uniref:L-asparaginase 2 n=1 Tax=Shewanella sp. SM87 TaxID=2912808 RepID=UPI0021D7D805|nr:L-asparaginase 2 [Shewanella sp. SM87]MCU8007306.1 L-asparaginase 2 [Shewanella sp. SM87]